MALLSSIEILIIKIFQVHIAVFGLLIEALINKIFIKYSWFFVVL